GPVIVTNKRAPVHGLRVDYTSVLYQRHPAPRGEIPAGVYVSEVLPGSHAERERLLDQVVTHVNGREVNTPEEFYRAAARVTGPLELTLACRNGDPPPRKVSLD